MDIASNKLVVGSIAANVQYHSTYFSYGKSYLHKFGGRHVSGVKPNFYFDPLRWSFKNPNFKQTHLLCLATKRQKDFVGHPESGPDSARCVDGGENGRAAQLNDPVKRSDLVSSGNGFMEACRFAYNDAKFVNDRAKNDLVLLSRGLSRLNDRARQDFRVLGHEFLKLDARAREDTEKIDADVKMKAARLNHIAAILKDRAQSDLKRVADQHWSDGALEADLRRADFLVKRRAMEDAFMALKFVSDIHNMMVDKMIQQRREEGIFGDGSMDYITLERNGIATDRFPGEVSSDRITAIQEAYWSMASAFSEADGIDYTDPDELELLVTTLIDLDAMDGKSTVSLLAECSSSPDVNTRRALANALATAPSMWTLGNAGMGALKRLADDSNPAVAAAASRAIDELKTQWALEEGDTFKFMVNDFLQREKKDINIDPDVEDQ
ncbi:senescence-associated family protein [Wolffia australiana]